MSTTEKENPFAGMEDANGNVIPENEGDGLLESPPQGEGEKQEDTDAGSENLFNPDRYNNPALQLPRVDGQSIDRIELKFAGTAKLDRSNPDDVELFRRFQLGKSIDVKVGVRVVGSNAKEKDDADGNTEAVISIKTLDVDTIYPLSVED